MCDDHDLGGGQASAGQASASQNSASRNSAGPGSAAQGGVGQDGAGQDGAGQDGAGQVPAGLSRRNFVQGTAAVAAATVLLQRTPRLPLHSAARPAAADGTSAYSMAMHIHSSFSEQSGSMDCHLYQATTNAVDVVWWSDHDARMEGIEYRDVVHFTSLDDERGATGQGGPWHWQKQESGPLNSAARGGIVQKPCSPNDPVSGGSLHIAAQSKSSTAATYGYYANCKPGGWNYRDNLTGQSLSIDVKLNSGWHDGYLEMLIDSSYHQALSGRLAGRYSLSYRFVPSGSSSRVAQGTLGVITIPVTGSGGSWYTATVKPSDDIAALWPDMDYRDFALFGLTLNAVSTGDLVEGYFDYLRFDRSLSGEAFLKQQAEMEAVLAPKYPDVVQQQALEISRQLPHLNWFGGDVVMTDYTHVRHKDYADFLASTVVPMAHKAGGLVSYNHPFGFSATPTLPPAQQNALVSSVAKTLLGSGGTPAALGCDLLEVGYKSRAGVDLAHHMDLWDIMSRNAVFLTGNGTTDDHFGTNWRGIHNNWITSAWAASTAQSDLLAAMAAGRSWCGSITGYRGSLDLTADGNCPMGSVSVSKTGSRKLAVTATKVPSGGTVQVLQGDVDYAGTQGLSANTKVIASYPASKFANGAVSLKVGNGTSSFVRTVVLQSSGEVVGASNPVWLLRSAPPGGIPTPRQA